jgi:hypothetical protein
MVEAAQLQSHGSVGSDGSDGSDGSVGSDGSDGSDGRLRQRAPRENCATAIIRDQLAGTRGVRRLPSLATVVMGRTAGLVEGCRKTVSTRRPRPAARRGLRRTCLILIWPDKDCTTLLHVTSERLARLALVGRTCLDCGELVDEPGGCPGVTA